MRRLIARWERMSPAAITAIALGYVTAIAVVDWCLPPPMTMTLFFLLGVVFAGWGAGCRHAILLAFISALFIAVHDARLAESPAAAWPMLLWNASTRFVLLSGAGWLTAKVARLTRELGNRVEEQTAAWKAEAERHRATAQSLTDALERLERDMAQRQRAEAAVRQSEALYRTLAEASPDAIFILDRDLRVKYVNSAGAGLWQRQPADLVGQTQAALFPSETARRHGEVVKRVMAGERVAPRDERIPFPGGERWLETRLVRVCDEQGQGVAVLGVSRDITERKRTEFVLQAQRDVSESLSLASDRKAALDRLLTIAVQLDGLDAGGVYLVEPRTGELHLAAHRGLSASFIERVSRYPTDAPEARLVEAGRPVYGSYTDIPLGQDAIRDQEGLRSVAILPLCHDGRVLGALNLASHTQASLSPPTRMVVEAIAAQAAGAIARIWTAEALKQSEARLRTIVAGVPVVLFALDGEGVITFEEGQALAALGVAPGARVGQSAFEVFRHSPPAIESVRRALHGEGHSAVIELGSQVFDCRYSPTRNVVGELTGCIGVATNVTQAHRLERQILEISDREQARIGQDIHDGLCQQLVSLAFDANSLERQLTQEQHAESETARRLASLLDQAISESRQLARGLFPVRLELEGLPSALEELAKATRERHGLECVFVNGRFRRVASRAMAIHLYRIAQEAVTNSLRHAHPRRITIRLEQHPDRLEECIEDDGIGLSPQQRSQAKGMGLHIMGYRARSLGGTLQIGRGSSGGTTVSCCVPYRLE